MRGLIEKCEMGRSKGKGTEHRRRGKAALTRKKKTTKNKKTLRIKKTTKNKEKH